MPGFDRTYSYYRDIFRGREMPFAFVDLDLFDENVRQLALRAGDKAIRIASKSVRCTALLKRVFEANITYQGIMCYSLAEAVWLSRLGFNNLLMGYPNWQEGQVEQVCSELKKGKAIILMVDMPEHIHHLNELGKKYNTVIPVCMDLDMSSDFPGVHFGVWRSSVTDKEKALELYHVITASKNIRLDGLMGYEAQIAGVGDKVQGKALMNNVIRFLKKRSIREIATRREETVKALKADGADLKLVNGGGTGSLEWTKLEESVTEVTVGSGFYASGLFDSYSNFKHYPSAVFAIEIVRKPKPDIYTCHGGGYIASGSAEKNKLPLPYLPHGAHLIDQEGAGEVQTPVVYNGPEKLNLGDPIFMRHSKAGELCERFKTLLLVKDGKVVDEVPTYRGEGQCFV